jgi:hypothetical protein
MNFGDLSSAISNFGFPVAVAGYLLFVFERKIEAFGNKIDRFSEVLEGKPSDNRKGLIDSIQENTKTTERLVSAVDKLTKTQ